jgi:hypothetical protein
VSDRPGLLKRFPLHDSYSFGFGSNVLGSARMHLPLI